MHPFQISDHFDGNKVRSLEIIHYSEGMQIHS